MARARRDVARHPHRVPRPDGRQHRPPGDLLRPRRLHLGAPMGRRLVRSGSRRAPDARRLDRRPLRPQAVDDGRSAVLRTRLGRRGDGRFGRDADRRSSDPGPGRRVRAPGHPQHRHQHLRPRRAGQGDRDLDRRRRHGHRPRPGDRRVPDRSLGLVGGLLDPPARDRRGPDRPDRGQGVPRPAPHRPRRARSADRHTRHLRARLRRHPGQRSGLDLAADRGQLRRGGCAARRVRGDRTAGRVPDAAAQVLPQPRLHRLGARDRDDVLRRTGDVLLPDTVLPTDPGPRPVRGRSADPPQRRSDRRRLGAGPDSSPPRWARGAS